MYNSFILRLQRSSLSFHIYHSRRHSNPSFQATTSQLFPSTTEVKRRLGKLSSIGDSVGISRRGAMASTSDLGRGVSRRLSLGREGGDMSKEGVLDANRSIALTFLILLLAGDGEEGKENDPGSSKDVESIIFRSSSFSSAMT
jgi:hypothetical protein